MSKIQNVKEIGILDSNITISDIDTMTKSFKIKADSTFYECVDPKICTCIKKCDEDYSRSISTLTRDKRQQLYFTISQELMDAFMEKKRIGDADFYLFPTCEGCRFNKNQIETDAIIAKYSAITYQLYSKENDIYTYLGSTLSEQYCQYLESIGGAPILELVVQ